MWKRATRATISLRGSLPWLGAFGLLVAGVAAIAIFGERLTWADIGFATTSWWAIPSGLALALFFVSVFAPIANAMLIRSGFATFDAGQAALASLPVWYLCLTVIIVAGGEEWLYRGYAIERLEQLLGAAPLAGSLSLVAFVIAHLPVWGIGVSLTTLVSGAIFTVLYVCFRDVSFLILAHVLTDLYGLVIARS
jgi:membrane protease YdiL (CAAX protease family)